MPGGKRRNRKKAKGKVPKSVKNYVKKQIHKMSETKYIDQLYSALVDSTGILADMFQPTQGTGDSQRIGDKVTIRGSRISIKLTCGDATNFVRIILFQWYPSTNLSVPTVGTILFDTTTADRAITTPYVHDYENQFHVFYDKVFTMSSVGDSYVISRVFKPNYKYVKKTCEFVGAGINASNKLYMLAISDSGAVVHPSVFAYWRHYYDDS